MARSPRLDFVGALQLVHIEGRHNLQILYERAPTESLIDATRDRVPPVDAARVHYFVELMATIGQECNMRVHAYRLSPNAATLMMQTLGAPLEAFMRRLCGEYAKYLHSKGPAWIAPIFRSRYTSKVIAPEYLANAVRRVHRGGQSFSSEPAYLGKTASVAVHTTDMKRDLASRGCVGLRGYQDFMARVDSDYVANLFAHGSPLDSRIVGSRLYVHQAKQLAAHPEPRPSQQQLMESVANLLDVTVPALYGNEPQSVLGRALVAWYALRSGAASIAEVGRWFEVTGATLGQAIAHHRRHRPELFDMPVTPSTRLHR